ncbi:hypothetical protein CVT25_000876 [Psilocybe cyanescens]|uniref:RNase H type-1 domain-containing protein n=1 Tax=Psilocybe cyanescens TaxID=93625 RepID=A0A409XEW7_PSICY|nr:hypothetical protein CVT25_000876 [Psilocybe cyanescens]
MALKESVEDDIGPSADGAPKPRSAQLYAHTFHNKICQYLDAKQLNTVNISWCPSHCDIAGNERADELAKEATKLACTAPIGVTRANALKRAKARTLKSWTREWSRTPKSGGFAPANRIPPSLRFPTPTLKHVLKLKKSRELFGRIIQCRMNHGYTGQFQRRFNLRGETRCPCGEGEIETREHILCHCPWFTEARANLLKFSKYLFLPEILGTEPGIKALANFLNASSAFTRTGTKPLPTPTPLFDDEPVPDSEDDESNEDY